MADIALVASDADRRRLEALAAVLGARGFEVAIGSNAVEAAKTVVIAWTRKSVRDDAVTAIASRVGDRLTPIFLDAVAPPAPFTNTSGELLTTWPEISSQGAFERLILQLESKTARTATASSLVPADLLANAEKARHAAASSGKLWPRFLGFAGIALVGAIAYTIFTSLPPASPPAQETCESAQQFCLSKEQLRSASEAELIEAAMEKASREVIMEAAAANDPLGAGLNCLLLVGDAGAEPAASRDACAAASQLGSTLGQLGLATLLEEGRPPVIAKDVNAARQLLSAAANAGNDVRAQTRLARLEHGDGNFTVARALADQCADAGVKDCRYLKAFMLEKAQGGPADMAEAVRIYTALADPLEAFPRAAVNLAIIYEAGAPPDIPANIGEAIRLYRLGEVFQEPYATYKLGDLAERGLLPGAGATETMNYYRAAAALGSEEAQAALDRLTKPPAP
jgi:TPR repeat protein